MCIVFLKILLLLKAEYYRRFNLAKFNFICFLFNRSFDTYNNVNSINVLILIIIFSIFQNFSIFIQNFNNIIFFIIKNIS